MAQDALTLYDLKAQMDRDGIFLDPLKASQNNKAYHDRKNKNTASQWLIINKKNDIIIAYYGDFKGDRSFKWTSYDRAEKIPAYKQKEIDKCILLVEVSAEEMQKREANAAAIDAKWRWDTAKDATEHKYLIKKGVLNHGLRQNLHGELVMPIYVNDAIRSIQTISEDGSKRFLKGGQKKGGYFKIGSGRHDVILIAEGYATAASLHENLELVTYVALDCHNMEHVALYVRQEYPNANIIICADVGDHEDIGVRCAELAAEKVGGHVFKPPLIDNLTKLDWNDYERSKSGGGVNIAREFEKFIEGRRVEPYEKELIDIMNEKHGLISVGNKVLFLDNGRFFDEKSMKIRYQNTKTVSGDRVVTHFDYWVSHENRREYDGVVVDPTKTCNRKMFNLWKGMDFNGGRGGKCDKLLNHIKDNICNGNQEHYNYLMCWIGDMFVNPERKPGVAVVFKGEGGVGKSLLAETILQRIIGGAHAVKISQSNNAFGTFNTALQGKLLVILSEAYWAGDKSKEGVVKDLITSNKIQIRDLYTAPIEVDCIARMVMVTNNAWVAQVSATERRFFVLECANHQRGNKKYFDDIMKQMDGGGYDAFVDYAKDYYDQNHKTVNLKEAPNTGGLNDQRELSLNSFETWSLDCLFDGCFSHINQDGMKVRTEINDCKIEKDDLYSSYISNPKVKKEYSPLSKQTFMVNALKYFKIKNPNKKTLGIRYVEFGGIDECRRTFCEKTNIAIDWKDGDDPELNLF